jgi:hypothetical protein
VNEQIVELSCQNEWAGGGFPNNLFCSEQVTHMTGSKFMREATWLPSAQKNVVKQLLEHKPGLVNMELFTRAGHAWHVPDALKNPTEQRREQVGAGSGIHSELLTRE